MSKGNKKIARTATEALKILWSKGFQKTWKKFSQFEERFAEDDYHFSSGELGMALKRAKYLTRRGTQGNYEYIQKYPFINDKDE
jgi:hypothetical protein